MAPTQSRNLMDRHIMHTPLPQINASIKLKNDETEAYLLHFLSRTSTTIALALPTIPPLLHHLSLHLLPLPPLVCHHLLTVGDFLLPEEERIFRGMLERHGKAFAFFPQEIK